MKTPLEQAQAAYRWAMIGVKLAVAALILNVVLLLLVWLGVFK